MSVTIHEPFLLANYKQAQKLVNDNPGSGSVPGVYARHSNALGKSDGYVTVAAHGNGVHVLDVSTLHAISSRSSGPSTVFACPVVGRASSRDTLTSYVAVRYSRDLRVDDRGKTIWSWEDNVSGKLEKEKDKKIAVAPHPVHCIYAPEELPSHIILISAAAEVSTMASDLSLENNLPIGQNVEGALLKSFIFPRKSCKFVLVELAPSEGVILVLICMLNKRICASIISVETDGSIVKLSDVSLPFPSSHSARDFICISCSSSGFLTLLTLTGHWHTFQLEVDGASIGASIVSDPLSLTGIVLAPDSVSVLCIGSSSHVLLAGIATSRNPQIVLLLWDLQYSVLLASHMFSFPSTLPKPSDNAVAVDLVPTNTSQSLLVLCPLLTAEKRKDVASNHSSLLVVPYAVPPVSTIADAIGCSSAGAKWLVQKQSSSSQLDQPKMELLDAMRAAVAQNRPEAAETVFFRWQQTEKERLGDEPLLGGALVKDIVEIITPDSNRHYVLPSKLLHYLLSRGAITGVMVTLDLVNILRAQDDWESLASILEKVPDVSEDIIVSLLHTVISRPHSPDATDHNDRIMAPELPSLLTRCVMLTTTPSQLRLAFRRHLRQADDVLPVLEVLTRWITSWGNEEMRLLSDNKPADPSDMPPLPQIISFLQSLLDASLLMMLDHFPSHQYLERLNSSLEQQSILIDQFVQLRGPLDPFVKRYDKNVKKGQNTANDGKVKEVVDWRKKRTERRERVHIVVGQYRLEEMSL